MAAARIAVLCSAHGFGHLTRQLAVGEELRLRKAVPVYFTAAPRELVHDTLPGAEVVQRTLDVGMSQRDSLSEDVEATLRLLAERCSDEAIDRLVAELRGYDAAIVDLAPNALEACRRAGIPALGVGNFDWPWLYRHYAPLSEWAERLAAWQAPHRAAELWPGPGLSGFSGVERFGIIGRRRSAYRLPRRSVLVCFGAFGLAELDRLLPPLRGVTYVLSSPMRPLDRPDCLFVEGVPYPALVAGADAVFTKPGYGIFAESALAGTPIAWLDRGTFPEAPYLEAAMSQRGDVKVRGDLADALEELWSRPRPDPADPGEARRLAARILEA
jgi:hypothetical protein